MDNLVTECSTQMAFMSSKAIMSFFIEIEHFAESVPLTVKFDILNTIDCPLSPVAFYNFCNDFDKFFGVIEKVSQLINSSHLL